MACCRAIPCRSIETGLSARSRRNPPELSDRELRELLALVRLHVLGPQLGVGTVTGVSGLCRPRRLRASDSLVVERAALSRRVVRALLF
jgi:hypothetical protein